MWNRAVADLVIDTDPQQFERIAEWVGDRDGMASLNDGQTIATLFFNDVSECEKLHWYCTTLCAVCVPPASRWSAGFRPRQHHGDRRPIGRTRQTVRQYVDGLRGPGQFPAPLGAPGGVRVWDWGSVNEWLRAFDESGDPEYHPTREFIAEFNASVARSLC